MLPSADTAAMLFWALLASGQINMRMSMVGSARQTPSINRLTSLPTRYSQNAGDRVTSNSNTSSDGTSPEAVQALVMRARIIVLGGLLRTVRAPG